MNELPPDLPRLRILETYLRLQLDAVRAAIQRAEKDTGPRGDQSPRGRAAAGRRERDAAVPKDDSVNWWRLAPGKPATLHRGDCTAASTGTAINRTMAQASLSDQPDGPPTAVACGRCRPDLGLA